MQRQPQRFETFIGAPDGALAQLQDATHAQNGYQGRADLVAKTHLAELPVYLLLLAVTVPAYGIGGAAGFQHILDQVDAPARAVEFVAQHLIGGAGRRAEPAMHAGPQDLVCPLDAGVLKLFGGEICLHQPIIPRFRMPRGSNFARSPAPNAATSAASGGKTGAPSPRINVACPRPVTAERTPSARPSGTSR